MPSFACIAHQVSSFGVTLETSVYYQLHYRF